MNYLELLPNDVMKIIDREIQNSNILKRRIERKQNKKMNRDQKRIAEHKIYLYEQFARLYNEYIVYQQNKNTHKELMTTMNIHKDYSMTFLKNMVNCFYIQNNVLEVMNHI
jgi:hypothetical protein